MPYITNKKRAALAKSTNQSYTLRKVVILATVISLIVLVAFAIACIATYAPILMDPKWQDPSLSAQLLMKDMANAPLPLVSYWESPDGKSWGTNLSAFSIFMIVLTIITLALAIVSMVLMITMRSPKATRKGINIMQGAALSGRKLGAHENATEIYRERATNPKKLKKGK